MGGALTVPELQRFLQKKNRQHTIREDEVQLALQHPDLEAVQVRTLWMLGRTGNEENDKFRSTLVGLFRNRDSVTKQDILDEYKRLHNTDCKLSEYVMRNLLREIAERADKNTYVLKGTFLRSNEA